MFDSTAESYLRVASISVAAFDFLQTFPAVWRFYKDHFNLGRFTISCVLMVLIQFTSILVMTIGSIGWSVRFTHRACLKFSFLPLVFQVGQAMVAQALIGFRAFYASQRSPRIGLILLACYGFVCTLQWITTLYQRQTIVDESGSCRAISSNRVIGAWAFYLIAITYDTLATVIAVVCLFKYPATAGPVMSCLTRMMTYDGVGYLIVLTASNGFNLILYFSYEYRHLQDIQSAAVSIGYAVTWIMSQRLLLHLHVPPRNQDITQVVTIAQSGDTTRAINRGARPEFEQKNGFGISDSGFERGSCPEIPRLNSVEVRIERTVQLQHDRFSFQPEDYSRSTGTSMDKVHDASRFSQSQSIKNSHPDSQALSTVEPSIHFV